MNAAHFELLEQAFDQAQAASASERDAIIEELARKSPESAAQLREMLRSPPLNDTDLASHLLDSSLTAEQSASHLPDPQIDKYRILSTLGEGGWGIVYLAEQPAPAHRLVAIKVIKPGMDSRQVLARFNDERQALAMMDHPCVVSSLDAGITSQGRPYVVMPLVAGLPINHFCTDENLSLTDRLSLFSLVCRGIEHAHAKGVIHRDIKPGNILVARTDTGPLPRIIDFGLAKAMNQPLTPHATVTLSGQIIGTPDYMSPEQSRAEGSDVRSDVYSLGAVLYELLAGRTPFDSAKLREAGPDGLRAILQNSIPPPPSTFASSHLARELDWITQRCLEKDPNRRYPTAAALADDIDRFLRGDRVNAGPPAKAYRAWRWMVKHRLVATAAVLIVASIATGFWYTQQARSRAEQVAKVTRSILTSVDPAVAQGRDTELLFLMLDQSKALLDDPSLDPHVELDLRETFALANDAAGRLPEAALHAKAADALIRSIEGQNSIRRLEMLRIMLFETTVVLPDPDDPEANLIRIGAEMRRVVRTHAQPDSDLDLRNEVTLARIISGGKLYQEPDQRRALLAKVESRFGPSDPDTIRLMRSLAKALADRGIRDAIGLLEEARLRAFAAYGKDSPLVHEGIAGEIYAAQVFDTPMQDVVAMAEKRLPDAERILGWRHRSVAVAEQNYAVNLVELGHCEAGIAALKRALEREVLNRGRDSGMAQWVSGTLAYAAIKCDDWVLFTECESQLWEVQPDSPAMDIALYEAILLEMKRRNDTARFDRWMTGLERRNPERAAEFRKQITE